MRLFLRQVGDVRTVFSLCENGECAFLVGIFLLRLLAFLILVRGIDRAPTGFDNHLTRYLKGHLSRLAEHSGRLEFTIRMEDADKAQGYEIIDIAFGVRHGAWRLARRDDGVVVGDFAVVKHLLRLTECRSTQGINLFLVIGIDAVHDLSALGVHIIGQEARIYTGVGGKFLFVKTLNELERKVRGITKLFIAIHLKGSEVVKMGRGFCAILLRYGGHEKLGIANLLQCLAPFLL